MKRYVIGIDYGTQSARAVLVNSADGSITASHTIRYPHGVMEGALASVEDYDSTLTGLLAAMAESGHAPEVAGICVDATSLTLVPLDKDGIPLAKRPDLSDREQAQIKLWKRHTAQAQSDEALALATSRGERFLARTGGTISSEWMLPKLLEMRDTDPLCWNETDLALDLCEYLTYSLTGTLSRSTASMGFKCHWCHDLGLPSADYLNSLRPGFGEEYSRLLRGEIAAPGIRVGTLKPELAARFGFPADTAVAAGVLDGHTAMTSLGALHPGDGALVVGTSTVLTIQTEELCEIDGICGIVRDGFTKGMFGIETGQGCTGDMLEWYMKQMLPRSVFDEAERLGVSPHTLLAERMKNPHENRVTAADWWNGSRNAPCDLTLSGVMAGLTLDTRPEDIYMALLQAMVCGTRAIVETCAGHGVPVKRLLVSGGMAKKSPALMQQYANILHMPLSVGNVEEGPALGAALFASVAAGIYPDALSAWENMGIREFTVYKPDESLHDAYETLYRRNRALRQAVIAMERL